MYKEIIITILIVVLIFVLDVITNNYTSNAVYDLSADLDNLKQYIESNTGSENIINKTDEVFNNWKKHYNVLAYYIEHDELEKVETQLTMLKADSQTEEYEECIKEIETTQFILRHIENKEEISLQSIC